MGKKAAATLEKPKKKKKPRKPVLVGLDSDGRPPDFPYVKVKGSSIHNRGLFAARSIPEGEQFIQYLGEIISKKESERRGIAQHEAAQSDGGGSVYIFEIDDKRDIDGNYEWNIARLANHSCEPNCEALNCEGEIWLVALRKIAKGEEITFDYGYALEHWKDHPCRCGSPRCVGYIVRAEDRKRLAKLVKKESKKPR